jgi:hypothetical protein
VDVSALLLELYGRIPPLARQAVEGVDAARLRVSPAPGTNSIGWLVWHLARVQDHHVAEILGVEQLALSCAAPKLIDAVVGRDPQQPRAERAVAVVARERAVRAEKDLTGGVVGTALAEHPATHPLDVAPIGAKQRTEIVAPTARCARTVG